MILLVLLLAVGVTWFNYNFLVPLGGDEVFAPIWEASQLVLEDNGNPYTPQAVERSSILLSDSPNPPRFLYPYYSIPVFAPFAMITSYSMARAVWMTVMFGCLVGLIFTALALTRWQPHAFIMLVYLVFALGSIASVRAFFLGNPALLASIFVGFGLLLVVQERYGAAGVFFGLSIIKPQMVFLLLVFVLLWAVSKRYLQMAGSMVLTVLILVGGAVAVSPIWFVYYYYDLLEFFKETFPASFAAAVWAWLPDVGPLAMGLAALGLFIWLLVEWWRALGKDSRWFLWTASLTLTVSCLVGLPSSISNQVVLLVPLALVFSLWSQRFQGQGNTLSVVVMILLLGIDWLAYGLTVGFDLSAPANLLMLILRPAAVLLLLYWVRYWALNSVRLKVSHLEAYRRL
ncbi:MAG TPA: glycosyltransferase family 87 protein [Anaerolineales bacterium]|nr:glycosyltransferase family 87 protein [Anaerolineales bacterium]